MNTAYFVWYNNPQQVAFKRFHAVFEQISKFGVIHRHSFYSCIHSWMLWLISVAFGIKLYAIATCCVVKKICKIQRIYGWVNFLFIGLYAYLFVFVYLKYESPYLLDTIFIYT